MRKVLRFLHCLEDAALAALLAGMLFLAGAQIVLRNFFDVSLIWGDPALRAGVLWVGMLGAVAASRGGKHISIDMLSKFLPPRQQSLVSAGTQLFAAAVCVVIGYHSLDFVRFEYEDAGKAFASVPVWLTAIVIPIGFGLLSLRFVLHAIRDLRRVGAGDSPQGGDAA